VYHNIAPVPGCPIPPFAPPVLRRSAPLTLCRPRHFKALQNTAASKLELKTTIGYLVRLGFRDQVGLCGTRGLEHTVPWPSEVLIRATGTSPPPSFKCTPDPELNLQKCIYGCLAFCCCSDGVSCAKPGCNVLPLLAMLALPAFSPPFPLLAWTAGHPSSGCSLLLGFPLYVRSTDRFTCTLGDAVGCFLHPIPSSHVLSCPLLFPPPPPPPHPFPAPPSSPPYCHAIRLVTRSSARAQA